MTIIVVKVTLHARPNEIHSNCFSNLITIASKTWCHAKWTITFPLFRDLLSLPVPLFLSPSLLFRPSSPIFSLLIHAIPFLSLSSAFSLLFPLLSSPPFSSYRPTTFPSLPLSPSLHFPLPTPVLPSLPPLSSLLLSSLPSLLSSVLFPPLLSHPFSSHLPPHLPISPLLFPPARLIPKLKLWICGHPAGFAVTQRSSFFLHFRCYD